VPVPAPVPTLPRPLTTFVGRERELAALADLIRNGTSRLVVLTGPGGVGKTRLAVELSWSLADHLADGVAFASLVAFQDPVLVAEAIARAVAAPERRDQSDVARIVASLGSKRVLLVIDNFEHVTDAAPLLTQLLDACPGLTLLVASRTRLHLTGEVDFPITPLPLPPSDDPPLAELQANPSMRLFEQRASAVLPGFALTADNAPAIASICRRLDGLPLAIELAAARTRALAPRDLLARLGQETGSRSAARLRLLSGGPVDAPHRLSGVREAVAWSYGLLRPFEQRIFRRLAVFSGGFTLGAAESVAGGDPDGTVLDALTELVDQSLVRFEPDGASGARYSLLETIRVFALAELEVSGDAAAWDRLVQWCQDLADRARPAIEQTGRGPWFDRLEAELGNIRTALGWLRECGDGPRGSRLIAAVAHFFLAALRFEEYAAWAEAFFAAPGGDRPTVDRAWILVGLAGIAQVRHQPERVVQMVEEARTIFADLGERRGEAASLENLATVAETLNQPERAVELYRQCIAISQALGNADDAAVTQIRLAIALRSLGRADEATPLAGEAVATLRGLGVAGNQWLAFGLYVLGSTALAQTDLPLAGASQGEALALGREMDDRVRIAHCLEGIGEIAYRRAELVRAVRLAAAAASLERALGLASDQEPTKPAWLEAARTRMGAAGYVRAWEAGAGLSLDAAVTEGLAVAVAVQKDTGKRRPVTRNTLELSSREREVLALLIEGRSDREIAAALGISPRTAETHVFRLCVKLGVEGRAAAVAAAFRLGLA
jgi:non-specific serine/threonine protein kinase